MASPHPYPSRCRVRRADDRPLRRGPLVRNGIKRQRQTVTQRVDQGPDTGVEGPLPPHSIERGFDDGMSVFASHDRHLVMGTAARDAKDGSLRPPRLAWDTALEGMPFGAKCAIGRSGPLSQGKSAPTKFATGLVGEPCETPARCLVGATSSVWSRRHSFREALQDRALPERHQRAAVHGDSAQRTGFAPSGAASTAGSMPTRKPRRPPLMWMRGSASTVSSTYTGIALRRAKGEVPPTR